MKYDSNFSSLSSPKPLPSKFQPLKQITKIHFPFWLTKTGKKEKKKREREGEREHQQHHSWEGANPEICHSWVHYSTFLFQNRFSPFFTRMSLENWPYNIHIYKKNNEWFEDRTSKYQDRYDQSRYPYNNHSWKFYQVWEEKEGIQFFLIFFLFLHGFLWFRFFFLLLVCYHYF